MKKIVMFTVCAMMALHIEAQVKSPKLSPLSKVSQRIGLTDLSVEYSRPSKSGRVVFGDLVPFDEVWRTGANENTKFTTSDMLFFGKDTLMPGTYALYTKPGKISWEVYFYSDITNWGTPDVWDASKIVLKLSQTSEQLTTGVETFNISFKDLSVESAKICLEWENTCVCIPFTMSTKTQVLASIEKTMAGPTATDYYDAASFYLREKKEMKVALDWITKAVDMKPDAFWMLRTKALIQAELGDKKGAIVSAKKSMELAEKASYQNYVDMNKKSIEEWSKK